MDSVGRRHSREAGTFESGPVCATIEGHVPRVFHGDLFDDGEPQTGTAVGCRVARLEDVFASVGRDARAVVHDVESGRTATDRDSDVSARVLDAVPEQVFEQSLEALRRPSDGR